MSSSDAKKTVLIIGGSFGGLVAASTLGSQFNVIVVDRKSYFEFTPSMHYALQEDNYIDRITADLSNYAKKHKFGFIFGSVIELNPTKAIIKRHEGQTETVSFDYCIIATGSNYASQIKTSGEACTLQERKQQIKNLIDKLKSSHKILIVGGGPVGIEVSSVCKEQFKNLEVHLWQKSKELLMNYSQKARMLAHNSLTKLGVKITYEKAMETLPVDQFDYIFDCRGNSYAPVYMKNQHFQQYIDSQGRIKVDEYLRLENNQNIFCVGDACISPYDEPKMSYNASIQGQFAAQNIVKIEKGEKNLKKLSHPSNIFNITTGKKNAIFCMGQNVAIESSLFHHMKMFIEKVACSAYKGSSIAASFSHYQRQSIIFVSYLKSKFTSKKDSTGTYQKLQ